MENLVSFQHEHEPPQNLREKEGQEMSKSAAKNKKKREAKARAKQEQEATGEVEYLNNKYSLKQFPSPRLKLAGQKQISVACAMTKSV